MEEDILIVINLSKLQLNSVTNLTKGEVLSVLRFAYCFSLKLTECVQERDKKIASCKIILIHKKCYIIIYRTFKVNIEITS